MFHHGVYLEFWHFNNHSLLNWSKLIPACCWSICLFKIQNLFYMYFCNCNSVEFNKNIDTDASVKICCDWLDFVLLIFMVIALQEKLIVLHQGKWQSVGLSLAKDLLSVRRHLKIAQFSFFSFTTSFGEVIISGNANCWGQLVWNWILLDRRWYLFWEHCEISAILSSWRRGQQTS